MTTHALPCSEEAEKAFLSCVIQCNAILNDAADFVSPKLFYHPTHRRIFDGVLELWKEGKDADLVTLTASMSELGTLDLIGGASNLAECFIAPAVPSNWRQYLDILRHKHTARLAISAAEKIIMSANNPADCENLSEVVQKALVSVAADAESKGRIETAAEVAMNRLSVYEDMVKNRGKLIGVPSGFKTLDETTGGFRNGQVIVIGAPTKGGKTALALNMAMRAASRDVPVGIISLEMSSGELLDRLVASLSGAAVADLSRDPTKALMDKIRWGISQVSKLPIFIRDESSINPLQLRAAARRMVAAHGVKLLVVDYIQLIEPLNRKDGREQQVAEASRTIKILAKELGIPIIALTQLNSEGYSRESRGIEHDCDLFLKIQRDEKQPADWWLNIALSRATSTGRIPLSFKPEYLRFDERE
jgi:replicative DNA helicase